MTVAPAETASGPARNELDQPAWTTARRAAHGSVFLLARQGAATVINIAGGVALAHLLSPGEYGVYAIVVLLVAFGTSVGDAGLGASLVRQKETPTQDQISMVFTAQLVLGIGLAAVILAVAGPLTHAYANPFITASVLRWGALAVVLLSLQGIPASLLDRDLSFGRVAVVNTVEVVVFNAVAIIGAVAGLHARALPIALVAETLVGTILLWVLRPTQVRLTRSTAGLRDRAKFGVLYQASSFVSFVKDAISPLLVGALVGAAALGYVEWAQIYATYSVVALAVLQRVYLPAFAKLLDSPSQLKRALDGAVHVGNLIVAPLAVLSVVLAHTGVPLVFGERWTPALPVFYLLAFANLFVPTVAPLIGVLNAQGRSGVTFTLTVGWMALTWLFGVPLILVFGKLGYGLANVLVVLSNIVMIRWVRASIPFELARVPWIWVKAGIVGGLIYLLTVVQPANSLWLLGGYAALGLVAYAAVVYLSDRATVTQLRMLLR